MLTSMYKTMRRSLKWKLISIIVTILVFTVSLIGLLGYNQTSSYLRRDIDHLSVQVLKQANMNLDRYYAEYEFAFLMFSSSLEVRDWMRMTSPKLTSESIRTYEWMKENYLNRMFLQYPEVLSVSLYNPRGFEQHFCNLYTLPLNYSIQSEPYFQSSGNFEKIKFITGMSDHYLDSASKPMHIPVLTLFKQVEGGGYLKIDISLGPSQRVMDQISITSSGAAAVVDDAGTIIHHSNADQVMGHLDDRIVEAVKGKKEGAIFEQSGNELVVFQTIPITGWKIIAILPYEEIGKSISSTRNMMLVVAIGALIISAILTYFAASSITRRILALRRLMKTMQLTNDLNVRARVEGSDEVADLSISFNNLLGHLEQSVHDLAETRVLQHRAVVSALQAQINSHFLYNTLETINSMAVIAKQPHIGLVSVNLSNMLRYTSDYKHIQVTVREELQHLEHYLRIMKVRYKDEVTYEINVPPELQEAICTKALLQPLVENCIKHGRETTGESVHIEVAGQLLEDGRLRLTVRDNGCGFDEATLTRLQEEQGAADNGFDRSRQVGLSNLIYRLRLFAQAQGAMAFYNLPDGGGAVVEITLPLTLEGGAA
ncbi:histidine kinase [Paenibacillus athensensis]|nr:sensor histidine kinase [Paenibacillus athensensis]MCD1257271.1 histidine kinase [Paenibacillus athensensis]